MVAIAADTVLASALDASGYYWGLRPNTSALMFFKLQLQAVATITFGYAPLGSSSTSTTCAISSPASPKS